MHRRGACGGAELFLHAQVFTGHRQQCLDPFTLGVAVHRLGDRSVEGHGDLGLLAPGRELVAEFTLEHFRRLADRHAQVDREFEGLVIHADVGQ
ncbi:hypothetical protein D3C76_1293070 [compost metagenome]